MGGNGGGFGFSWEIYVKETRPKGQRLPNEVDPERAQLHYTPYVKDESDVGMASSWNLLESVDAALLGEPEHFEAHEIKEPEMDGDLIDAVLKPFLDQLPMVSDERDIDEPDADAEVVFKTPIVGGSASLFSQRKLRSHLMNKIHAVDFKLDGSGVVNILDTDVTRDPKKLELRKEPTSFTEDGPVIIRRYDLTDEEHHRQLEKEIFEDTKTAEEKLRAGDPAASIEIRGGFWLRRDCADHWGHCWSVHQAEDQGSGNDDLLQEGSTVAEGFNGGIANVVSEAQSTTLDMPYRITHVKACQGHDQSLIEKVGTSPLAKQVIELAGL